MSVIGGCIEKKSSGIAANNVLIESLGENNARLTAMGQDLTMRYDVAADVKTSGSLCLDGARLAAIAPTLPSGDVSFTKQDNQWAKIDAGKSKIKIAGVDPATFPPVPSGKSTPVLLGAELLQTLIKRVIFVASDEASQYTLNAVKLSIGGGYIEAAGVVQVRFAIAKSEAAEDLSVDLVIPKRTAMEILKIDADTLKIGDDQNHIFVEGDGLLIVSRKVHGKFPNYEMAIPKDNKLEFTFDVEEMTQAVRRCGMFAAQDTKTVRCGLSAGEAMLTSKTAEAGEIEDSIAIEYSGEPHSLGFVWPDLLEFLTLAESGKATISFNESHLIPAILTAENLPDYEYILVLVNLPVIDAKADVPAEKAKAKKAK